MYLLFKIVLLLEMLHVHPPSPLWASVDFYLLAQILKFTGCDVSTGEFVVAPIGVASGPAVRVWM